MKYDREYIKELMQKQIAGTATDEEREFLLAALDLYSQDEISAMIDEMELPKFNPLNKTLDAPSFKELYEFIEVSKMSRFVYFLKKNWIESLVFFFFIIAVGLIIWKVSQPGPIKTICGENAAVNILPTASYSSNLMLPDGSIILINSSLNGLIKKENGFEIYKWPDGIIEFKMINLEDKKNEKGYYIISTSNGQQYRIILPDSTRVRLNAASSIRFPVSFSSHHFIEVTGEAFIDVPQSIMDSLFIQTKDANLVVTGTELNINTYNLGTIATLFNGKMELRSGSQFTLLKPGEQALTAAYGFYRKDSAIVVKKVDTSIVKSWMGPQRKYTEITLQEFVLEMGRLYDFEIVNINCVSKKLVSVYMCYNKPMEELFSLFNQMGLRFNYAEKKIRFCPPVYQTKKHLSQMIPTINY